MVQMKRFSHGIHGLFILSGYSWLCNHNKPKEGIARAQYAGSFDGLLSVRRHGSRSGSHSGYNYEQKENQ